MHLYGPDAKVQLDHPTYGSQAAPPMIPYVPIPSHKSALFPLTPSPPSVAQCVPNNAILKRVSADI